MITINGSKITTATWGDMNKTLFTGHEDGSITVWDIEQGIQIQTTKQHTAAIQDFQFSKDKTHFITASKDCTSKLFDSKSLNLMKKFITDRPINSAAISPIKAHIMLGGGQEAMSVTTTAVRQGKFEVRFFHQVFEEEIARVKGHFGPINTLAFHPNGKSFSSGGEDGYIRVHKFPDQYFTFSYPEESQSQSNDDHEN